VRHGSAGADLAVIEGVMGMFDGASGRGELASTAHVAKLLQAPVVLVVDAGAMARSAAAIVHGYRTFDPGVEVAGVIFNRVGSDHHEELLREATADIGVPVLGALRRDDRIVAPSATWAWCRPASAPAQTRAALDALAEAAARYIDLDAIERLARAAPAAGGPAWDAAPGDEPAPARIAIARGPAFSFHYEENLELLAAAGAELVPFDPTADERLPEGADALAAGRRLPRGLRRRARGQRPAGASEVAAFARRGRPILAECGGLLYLSADLDGRAMCGVLAGARGRMAGPAHARLPRGGSAAHRDAVDRRRHEPARARVPLLAVEPIGAGRGAGLDADRARRHARGGHRARRGAGGYLHVHWAAHRDLCAPRFVQAAAEAPSPREPRAGHRRHPLGKSATRRAPRCVASGAGRPLRGHRGSADPAMAARIDAHLRPAPGRRGPTVQVGRRARRGRGRRAVRAPRRPRDLDRPASCTGRGRSTIPRGRPRQPRAERVPRSCARRSSGESCRPRGAARAVVVVAEDAGGRRAPGARPGRRAPG
jgi:cobyrinic acid a,c-diamide synthase